MSDNTKLKKNLRLFDVFSISTGAMFSSGFFLLPGLAAAQTGPSVFLAYLASGLLIIPAMLSVAELSTAMPKSGGTYYFLDRALGPLAGTIGGLGSWVALMFKSSFALIGMGAYLSLYLDLSFTALALVLTVLFGLLNIFGAKETTLLQRILVSVLVVIMGFFIIQGMLFLDSDMIRGGLGQGVPFFSDAVHGFIGTVGLVFVSYAGLTKVTSVAEEVENPDRNIPLGMFLSLGTAVIIYVAGVFVMQSVLPASELQASLTPVSDAAAVISGWLPGNSGVILIVVAAVAAFASTGNAGIMSASRYPFAMARDRLISPRFEKLGRTGTPVFSILVTAACMIGIILLFNVEAVAKLASAFQLLLFGLLCLTVLVMRESRISGYHPGFRSPMYPWVQIAGIAISFWLIAEMGFLAISFTGLIMLLCSAWYFWYGKKRTNRRGAIYHIHERLGRRRYDHLEYELLSILNQKNTEKHLSYKEIISRALITDLSASGITEGEVAEMAARKLSGRLGIEKLQLMESFKQHSGVMDLKLSDYAECHYRSFTDVKQTELVIFRIQNADTENHADAPPNRLAAYLICPAGAEGLEIRIMGHLAEVIQTPRFTKRWAEAVDKKQLRQALLSDEHFISVQASANPLTAEYCGKALSEIPLPGSCLITVIYRDRDLLIPHGHTVILPGDELLIIGDPSDITQLQEATDINVPTVKR